MRSWGPLPRRGCQALCRSNSVTVEPRDLLPSARGLFARRNNAGGYSGTVRDCYQYNNQRTAKIWDSAGFTSIGSPAHALDRASGE